MTPEKLKHLQFHANDETPILNLTLSRESAEWLVNLIPRDDNGHKQLRDELYRYDIGVEAGA